MADNWRSPQRRIAGLPVRAVTAAPSERGRGDEALAG
jgi:hypothetical protein